jgi:hypothetical protein
MMDNILQQIQWALTTSKALESTYIYEHPFGNVSVLQGRIERGRVMGAATPASNKKVPFFLAQMTVFALRTAIPHPPRKLSSSSSAVLVAGSAHLIVFHLIYRLNKIFSQSLCKTEYGNFKKKQSVHYDF